jgi:hypothetical protein
LIDLTSPGPFRWHANDDLRLQHSCDHIRGHQDRVAVLCDELASALGYEISPALDKAARHHDEAERVLGDLPGPAKERFPALAAAYAKAELEVLTDMGLCWTLSRLESAILDICDKLDAMLWGVAIQGWTPEWVDTEKALCLKAEKIGAASWVNRKLAHLRPSVCQFGG